MAEALHVNFDLQRAVPRLKAEHRAPVQPEIALEKLIREQALIERMHDLFELSAEYASLLEQKQKSYAEYRNAWEQMRELLTAKANIDTVTQSKEDSSNQHSKRKWQTK